ncbi:hypothetical protein G7054_g1165 [Neopestalotiopsis clavispora]|nr:hypothetical protein G7054_g1165 [Neopestalotiopsis clavispora]
MAGRLWFHVPNAQWGYAQPTYAEEREQAESQGPADLGPGSAEWQLAFDSGWCKHQIIALHRELGPAAFSHFSTMRPLSRKRADHYNCLDKPHCVAFDIDLDTADYKPRHVDDDCTCEHISVSQEDLVRILQKKDGVPLAKITGIEDGRLRLHLQERKTGSTYTAVSHVWADGLGNLQDNALPECQLRKLHERLVDLMAATGGSDSEHLFWLDALCVPPDQTASDRFQANALGTMASIYAEARQVLVLDRELMQIEPDELESMARVVTSAWMHRCWTYQEGILSKSCAFQFRNEIRLAKVNREPVYNPNFQTHLEWESQPCRSNESRATRRRTHRRRHSDSSRSVEEDATSHMMAGHQFRHYLLHKFFGVRSVDLERYELFVYVWNSLTVRTTSRESDKTLILATLMGLSRQKLREVIVHDRKTTSAIHLNEDLELGSQTGDNSHNNSLRAILSTVNKIPIGLLFTQTGKLRPGDHHANRWIPTDIGHANICDHLYMSNRSKYLELKSDELDLFQRTSSVSVLVIQEVIPISIRQFDLRRVDGDLTCALLRIRTENPTDDNIDTSGFNFTCIFTLLGSGSTNHRAAILYGKKVQNSQHLELFYHCSAELENVHDNEHEPHSGSEYTRIYLCQSPEYARIRIQCGNANAGTDLSRQLGPSFDRKFLRRYDMFCIKHGGIFLPYQSAL